MAAEAQTCAIGIITILVALHLSRVLYKSTLFMQNKANLLNSRMNVSPVLTKDYENKCLRRAFKNKAKQTQSNPISNPALSAPKNTPNFPVFPQFRIILIDKLCEDLLQKCLRVIRIGSKARAVISASPSEISFRGSQSHSRPAWYCGYKHGLSVFHNGFAETAPILQATASGAR